MPSEAAKKRAAQKKAQKQASSRSAQKKTVVTPPGAKDDEEVRSKLTNGASATTMGNGLHERVAGMKISQRSCTGTYCDNLNHPILLSITMSYNIMFSSVSNQIKGCVVEYPPCVVCG